MAGINRQHRKAIESLWRLLHPGQSALLVDTPAPASANVSPLRRWTRTSTAWRYVEETVMLLAQRSPKPAAVLRKAREDGVHYLVLDGTQGRDLRARRQGLSR